MQCIRTAAFARTAAIALFVLLVVVPSAAFACSTVLRPPLEPHIARADLRTMHNHESARGTWVRDAQWKSYDVGIDQEVKLAGMTAPVKAAFRQQRSIRLTAVHPVTGRYFDDEDPNTTCELSGKQAWSTPKILVHETPRAVFITLVMKQTQGSTSGCIFAATSCDDITLRTITLDAPIGNRQLYSTTFD